MGDVLITGSSTELTARTKRDLKKRFEVTDCGKCAFVLVIKLVDNEDGKVTMCQKLFVDENLKRFGMDDDKAEMCPTDISYRLTPSGAALKVNASFLGGCTHVLDDYDATWCCISVDGHRFSTSIGNRDRFNPNRLLSFVFTT